MEEQLKEKFLRVLKLFKMYGVKSVTMNDIAREMGMSKKTLYKIVDDKENLIDLVFKCDFEHNECIIKSLLDDATFNAVSNFINIFKYSLEEYKSLSPVFIRDMVMHYPAILEWHKDRSMKQGVEKIISNLNFGMKEGLYIKSYNIEILAKILVSSLSSVYSSSIIEFKDLEHPEFYKHFLAFNLRPILTSKGIEIFDHELKKI